VTGQRPQRTRREQTRLTSDYPSVSTGQLYRQGRPIEQPPLLFTDVGPPQVEAALLARADHVECRAFFHDDRGRPTRNDFTVDVTWRAIENLPDAGGGVRPVFHCCSCDGTFRTLFFVGMTLMCRKCARLTYPSQHRRRPSTLERAEEIRLQLGGEPSVWAPFPPRPSGWSEERYERARRREEMWRHRAMMRALSVGRRNLPGTRGEAPAAARVD